jgi:hypothetical protein
MHSVEKHFTRIRLGPQRNVSLIKKHGQLHHKQTRLVRLPSLLRPTRKLWREGNVEEFLLSTLRLERFRGEWMRTPAYSSVLGKPDAQ